MRGFVPTPPHLVDAMVEKLFALRAPAETDTLLDPGCGTGAFIEGVLRWCARRNITPPRVTGVESDPTLLPLAAQKFRGVQAVSLLNEDFLTGPPNQYDFIVGNPPYVPITGLSTEERTRYRSMFATAQGRLDLYLLFFERALRLLKPTGRLVLITPEKYLYVQSAGKLRNFLCQFFVEEIELVEEAAFGSLVTYPTITTVNGSAAKKGTRLIRRDGTSHSILLKRSASWLPAVNGSDQIQSGAALGTLFRRISCGVATGADRVYLRRADDVPAALKPFAFPTIAGRQLSAGSPLVSTDVMFVPYTKAGRLLSEGELGPLGEYLRDSNRFADLTKRTCVRRKPWYAFHETPPLADILQPKILCKDIGVSPWFIIDELGEIVPRHSVYYLVPRNPGQLHELCDFLNSSTAADWLIAHCQRAANGFLRLQSHILKRLPVPQELVEEPQMAIA